MKHVLTVAMFSEQAENSAFCVEVKAIPVDGKPLKIGSGEKEMEFPYMGLFPYTFHGESKEIMYNLALNAAAILVNAEMEDQSHLSSVEYSAYVKNRINELLNSISTK